ncbi:helix-turn-helix domain-containing protein [Paraburkholderia bryophila]|uniref:helix-turn-helix domain-containing protein n=1 Tax=Paraburkholderia bryophila TaxID=420952 RepID=UPI003AF013A7
MVHICIFRTDLMSSPSNPRRIALSLAARFKSAGVTQNDIASAVGVSQSHISRILSGHIVKNTKLLGRLCIYASHRLNFGQRSDVRRIRDLMTALAGVWDGSDEHAHALAQIIRSLAEFNGLRERFVRGGVKR